MVEPPPLWERRLCGSTMFLWERLPAAIWLPQKVGFSMKPLKGSRYLRKGRASLEGHYYLLTAATHNKQRIFDQPGAAQVVLDSLAWLEKEKVIDLEAAVV